MKLNKSLLTIGIALAAAAAVALITGCPPAPSNPTPTPTVRATATVAATATSAATSTAAATATTAASATPTPGPNLTLSLDPTLDVEGGSKATSITKAELLNAAGAMVQTGTIVGGAARFNLSGLAAADYFIRINDLGDDLVPTRIDDPAQSVAQAVGQTLRYSVIGDPADPGYRVKTYSKGQGDAAIVKYSDGTPTQPERYAYALVWLKASPQKVEFRVLGTAQVLFDYTPGGPTHPAAGSAPVQPFDSWTVHFASIHHGEAHAGIDVNCVCHGNLDVHPASFGDIGLANGFCFRCHYGKTGEAVVDPAQ